MIVGQVAPQGKRVYLASMCGRYTAANPVLIGKMFFDEFDVHGPSMPARYNVAPWVLTPAIVRRDDQLPEAREMRWGFVPPWEKLDRPKIAPINAKSEEMAEKPMFRSSVEKRRCLIGADGFFEWKRLSEKEKLPYYFTMADDSAFFFAAIFASSTENRPETFALLTTRPNELMEPIHTRMPVIVKGEAAKIWLKSGALTSDEIASVTAPFPADRMKAVAVSKLVNSPKNDGPEILNPPIDDATLF